MITVANRPPWRVWRQQCSSTPRTRTSKRVGSSINSCRPAPRTASLTVCHDAPRPSATRAIESRSMTTDFNAHNTASRDNLHRGVAAKLVS